VTDVGLKRDPKIQSDKSKDPQNKSKVFTCDLVKQNIKRNIKIHENTNQNNTKSKEIRCNFKECGKVFSSQHRLYDHRQIHGPKFKCKVCNNEFIKKDIQRHLKTHDKNRQKFACEEKGCDAVCVTKKGLKIHIEASHMNIRLKCGINNCLKEYNCQSNLSRHKRTAHFGTEKPPDPCPVCEKIFSTKHNLENHMIGVHRPTGSKIRITITF
jgi:hypothetical protein